MCNTFTLKNNTRYQNFTSSGLNLATIYGLQVTVQYYVLTAAVDGIHGATITHYILQGICVTKFIGVLT